MYLYCIIKHTNNMNTNKKKLLYDIEGCPKPLSHSEVSQSMFLKQKAKARMPLAIGVIEQDILTALTGAISLGDFLVFNEAESKRYSLNTGDECAIYTSTLLPRKINLTSHLQKNDSELNLEFFYDEEIVKTLTESSIKAKQERSNHFAEKLKDGVNSFPRLVIEKLKEKGAPEHLIQKLETIDDLFNKVREEEEADKEVGEFSTLFEQDWHFFDPSTNTTGFITSGTILPKVTTQGWSFYLDEDSLNDFLNSRP